MRERYPVEDPLSNLKILSIMDKIINTIAQVIFKIDTILYRALGFVSPLRKQSWSRQGRRLQRKLDREHSLRDYLNTRYGTSYTTKQALALED